MWKAKYERLSEMCVVQHVETKSMFTIQPIKWLVFTTAKSAKPAATFRVSLLRTKNQQLCCLAVMEHTVYTSRDYEKPTPFLKKFLLQSHSTHQKRANRVQIWNKLVPFLLADLRHIISFQIISITFKPQSTAQI